MKVVEVKSVSGKTLFEVAHNGQTLSDPFATWIEAFHQVEYLDSVKGTKVDPLADYWRRLKSKQYHRNEKRIHRALNRIGAQWSAAYAAKDEAAMIDCDIRYNRALHVRAKVLCVVNGGGDVRAS